MIYKLRAIRHRLKHRRDNPAAMLDFAARAPEDMLWLVQVVEKAIQEGFTV